MADNTKAHWALPEEFPGVLNTGIFKLEYTHTYILNQQRREANLAASLSPQFQAQRGGSHSTSPQAGLSKCGRQWAWGKKGPSDGENRMVLILQGSAVKSLKQAEVTTLGVQITSPETSSLLVLESTGSLLQAGHSGPGKAAGKMTLSLERCLLPFSSRSPLPPFTQASHPHVYTHPLPPLPMAVPLSLLIAPRLRAPSFRCPLCHSCTSVFKAP